MSSSLCLRRNLKDRYLDNCFDEGTFIFYIFYVRIFNNLETFPSKQDRQSEEVGPLQL